MKKLILIVVLLFSLTVSAQVQQTFKDYSNALITEREVTQEWLKLDSRIFFNYGGDEKRVKIFIGNFVETYVVDGYQEGVTEGGFEYLAVGLSSAKGETVLMQIFKDVKYGVRIFFNEHTYIQIVE